MHRMTRAKLTQKTPMKKQDITSDFATKSSEVVKGGQRGSGGKGSLMFSESPKQSKGRPPL